MLGGRADLTEDRAGGIYPASPWPVLDVGITGHRAARLPDGAMQGLPAAIEAVLRALAAAALPATPVLHTPLATGADQIAATAARLAGYRVEALLPFAADTYLADFVPGIERDAFAAQLRAADGVTVLTGDDADAIAAYVAVGRAVIAASDVMVAVWDGAREIVPGGTAHVVELALEAGRPVIHIGVGAGADRAPMLLRGGTAIAMPLAAAGDYARLIAGLPPGRPPDQRVAPTIAIRS